MAGMHLSEDEWKLWRAKEKPEQRDARRLREAIDRTTSAGVLPSWSDVWAWFLSCASP